MFTGIVRQTGRVVRVTRRGGGSTLEVDAPGVTERMDVGDSIAVNGACVTLTGAQGSTFGCDLVPETLARTNLGTLQSGDEVNLELPLRAGDRLDGHLVQGHIDTVGTVRSRRKVGAQELLEVNVPFELTRYVVPKGSVSVDGVSLTVVDVNRDRFRVALIPHTVAVTTLGRKLQGQTVNVEVDVLSKYVERHLAVRMPSRPRGLDAAVAALDADGPVVMAPSARMEAPRAPAPRPPVPKPPVPKPSVGRIRPKAKPKPRPKPKVARAKAARRAPKRPAARRARRQDRRPARAAKRAARPPRRAQGRRR